MNKAKKITFVGFFLGYGGAEKSMIMVANGLINRGHDVTIVSLKENNIAYEINQKIKYIFIPDHNGIKLKSLVNRFWDLKTALMEIKPDIVISFWLQPAIFASLISKKMRFKTIYSERTDPSAKQFKGWRGWLRSIFFKSVDGFVFQTEGAKKCFSKSIQTRSTVINNPVYISYDEYPLPSERRKVIVNVGRLHEQKNQKLLINSFARISDLFPDYILEIYGDGSLKEALKKQIKELDLYNRVYLKGTTNELITQIIDASLFVLSSDYEGMPNALMEAMALGIPCITTDCKPGGARELIDQGENGIIVIRDSVDELASSMKYMIEHPKEAEVIGLKAKEICKTHSLNRIIMMWEKYITRVLERS